MDTIVENEQPKPISSIALSQERLKELLDYDPDTGLFVWKLCISSRGQVGAVAGSKKDSGYITISIGGTAYLAHKLAWFYVHGEWCKVDHKDNYRWHNNINNLRKATDQQNAANRESVGGNAGAKGVYLRNGKYEVGIKVNQVRIHLGLFSTLEEAKNAYAQAAITHFGEFAKT